MTVKCCGTCMSSDVIPDVPSRNLWCYLADDPVQWDELCSNWREE